MINLRRILEFASQLNRKERGTRGERGSSCKGSEETHWRFTVIMTDMIDEFNSQEWEVANENEVEGFEDYNLFRRKLSRAPVPQKCSGEFYYCVQDSTDKVRRVLLSGCKGARDPLSGVANCRLKLDENKGSIIGIHLDAQCIIKKQNPMS